MARQDIVIHYIGIVTASIVQACRIVLVLVIIQLCSLCGQNNSQG